VVWPLEVGTGFEPVYTALQAVASPLGHPTVVTFSRADDEIRTRDPHLGKVMRYQLRYVRTARPVVHPATDANSSRPSSPMPNRYPDPACHEEEGEAGAVERAAAEAARPAQVERPA
jgi:hypothetical protein